MKTEEKHYLDSSVLVKIIGGTRAYRKYLKNEISNKCSYVTSYVEMELRRAFLGNLIDFYFAIETVGSLSDAERLWTNKFGKRPLIPIAYFSAYMKESGNFSKNEKDEDLRLLSVYIRRVERLIKGYKNPGNDSTDCPKPGIKMPRRKDEIELESESLSNFLDAFRADEKCREECNIYNFLFGQSKQEIEAMIKLSKSMSGRKSQGKGFISICNHLTEASQKDEKSFTCKTCSKVGDAVITLLAPNDMQIEHTDNAFDFLCEATHKPHRKLKSEVAFMENEISK